MLKIKVHIDFNLQIYLDVEPNMTISQLKSLIFAKTKIPVMYQRLIFKGKYLRENPTLAACGIEDNSIIKVIQTCSSANRNQASNFFNMGEEDLERENTLNEIIRAYLENLSANHRFKTFSFQQNVQSFLTRMRFKDEEAKEVLSQTQKNMDILFNSCGVNEDNNKIFHIKGSLFQIGQWLDVKDRTGKWLEAQIVDIKNNLSYIHYIGKDKTQDEWISNDSSRISLFRSRSIQVPTSNYLSPFPNARPDQEYHESLSEKLGYEDIIACTCKYMIYMKQMLNQFLDLKFNQKMESQIKNQNADLNNQNLKSFSTQIGHILNRFGRSLVDLSYYFSKEGNPVLFTPEDPNTTSNQIRNFNENLNVIIEENRDEFCLMSNPGEVTVVSNFIDRYLFGNPSVLELHIHGNTRPRFPNMIDNSSQTIIAKPSENSILKHTYNIHASPEQHSNALKKKCVPKVSFSLNFEAIGIEESYNLGNEIKKMQIIEKEHEEDVEDDNNFNKMCSPEKISKPHLSNSNLINTVPKSIQKPGYKLSQNELIKYPSPISKQHYPKSYHNLFEESNKYSP